MVAAGVVAAGGWGLLAAQDQAKPADEPAPAVPARPADEAAIRAASAAFVQAFEKGDAAAVAALWTEEGAYVSDDGDKVQGRAALAKAYAAFFAKRKEVKTAGQITAVRFLGKDTAVEEGTFTVRARNAPAVASKYSALHVRQDGKWLIALLKEWSDEDGPASLEDLGWLIGTWEGQGPEQKVQTTYTWTENQAFLRGQYTITRKDGTAGGSGIQVIGVDPATKRVRSWTFDTQGGIGEATWDWEDDHWEIRSTATLPDGTGTTAVNHLAQQDDNAFTWRSAERKVGGVSLPDLLPVTVKRVAGGK
jgi:uncharacterized protein (TIGR02246 family)